MKYPCTSTVFFFRLSGAECINRLAADLAAAMPRPLGNAPQRLDRFLQQVGIPAETCEAEIRYLRIADGHLQMDLVAEERPPLEAYSAIASLYQLGWVADGIEPIRQLYLNTDIAGRFLPFHYILNFDDKPTEDGPCCRLPRHCGTGAILFRTETEVLNTFERLGLQANSPKALRQALQREHVTLQRFM